MATILEFPKRQDSAKSSRTGAALIASADIVIFPGIRYEYWEQDPGNKPGKNKPRNIDRQ